MAGAALNTTLLGAPVTITIWSELHDAVTSDAPIFNTIYAAHEMFDPIHIIATRGEAFYEAMQDFEFEEAGENLAEAEIAVGAVVAASVPEIQGAGTGKGPPNPYGKLGKPSTRAQNAAIAEELRAEGYKITGGGPRTPEEYIPGPGPGQKGSTYVDITAEKPGDTVRVQTVDTNRSGVPTPREMRNAGKILKANRDHGLFLIPKK
jgi:hypothetical protein